MHSNVVPRQGFMLKGLCCSVLLTLCLISSGFSLTVKGEKNYQPYEKIVLTVDDVGKGSQLLWDVSGGEVQTEETDNKLYLWAKPGAYVVKVTAIDFDNKKVTRTSYSFTVGGEKPDDVKPVPKPNKSPIDINGFAVLMVYDTKTVTQLPKEQQSILFGQEVRNYLKKHCTVESGWCAYRVGDQGSDLKEESKPWQNAMKRKRDSLPWIIISNGKTGYEGPLPKTVDEAIKLFDEYSNGESKTSEEVFRYRVYSK